MLFLWLVLFLFDEKSIVSFVFCVLFVLLSHYPIAGERVLLLLFTLMFTVLLPSFHMIESSKLNSFYTSNFLETSQLRRIERIQVVFLLPLYT